MSESGRAVDRPDSPRNAESVRVQKCPACDGQGLRNRPPWVAGDQYEWSTTSCGPWPCGPCNGTGLLWVIPGIYGGLAYCSCPSCTHRDGEVCADDQG